MLEKLKKIKEIAEQFKKIKKENPNLTDKEIYDLMISEKSN